MYWGNHSEKIDGPNDSIKHLVWSDWPPLWPFNFKRDWNLKSKFEQFVVYAMEESHCNSRAFSQERRIKAGKTFQEIHACRSGKKWEIKTSYRSPI